MCTSSVSLAVIISPFCLDIMFDVAQVPTANELVLKGYNGFCPRLLWFEHKSGSTDQSHHSLPTLGENQACFRRHVPANDNYSHGANIFFLSPREEDVYLAC